MVICRPNHPLPIQPYVSRYKHVWDLRWTLQTLNGNTITAQQKWHIYNHHDTGQWNLNNQINSGDLNFKIDLCNFGGKIQTQIKPKQQKTPPPEELFRIIYKSQYIPSPEDFARTIHKSSRNRHIETCKEHQQRTDGKRSRWTLANSLHAIETSRHANSLSN
jgi:hypothetical protein